MIELRKKYEDFLAMDYQEKLETFSQIGEMALDHFFENDEFSKKLICVPASYRYCVAHGFDLSWRLGETKVYEIDSADELNSAYISTRKEWAAVVFNNKIYYVNLYKPLSVLVPRTSHPKKWEKIGTCEYIAFPWLNNKLYIQDDFLEYIQPTPEWLRKLLQS